MRKILSIDGGGIKGVIPALILAEIEHKLGKPIAKVFDLIAGTSSGGITTLGLTVAGENNQPKFSASDMADFYLQFGDQIFHRSFWRGITTVAGYTEERYSHEPLEDLLKRYLGDALLGSALSRVLISSYNIEHRTPFFFKSWREESMNVPMYQVARATTAAPTYFEPAAPIHVNIKDPPPPPSGSTLERGEFAFIDGGVFVNNPAVSAYAEARRIFPDETDFMVVSLGTGEMTRPILYDDAKGWGKVDWVLPILGVVFDGVSDAVNYQMGQILDQEDRRRFYRFQKRLETAKDDIDDASRANLVALQVEARQILQTQQTELAEVCALLE